MEPNSESTTTKYQQVTVDVPEDRVAEFHAFFGRFLAGSPGRSRRGRHGRRHHHAHGGGCAHRHDTPGQTETAGAATEVTEV